MNHIGLKESKKIRRKRCRYCGRLFYPDPRVGEKQKACFQEECKKKRKHEAQRKWLEKNRDYFKGRYLQQQRDWFKENPKNEREIKATLKVLKSLFMIMTIQIDILAKSILSINNNFQDKKLKKYKQNQELIEKMLLLLEDKKR